MYYLVCIGCYNKDKKGVYKIKQPLFEVLSDPRTREMLGIYQLSQQSHTGYIQAKSCAKCSGERIKIFRSFVTTERLSDQQNDIVEYTEEVTT